ncbi:unnamed protein product [Polarella glacialis]|uniref:Carrier domain-containing protein n=1 Tax=Polarella glacialis TaxID=89957 RepID=A0A813KPD7_POLGL|nr:unnamed protein product [Polarella glacialis]
MALPFAEEGLQLSRGAHCTRLEASAARTLARVLVALGRISSAIDLLNDAKDLFRQTDARQAESVVLATLAEILALQGDVEEALNIGEAALQVAQELGDLRQEVLMLCSISELSLLSRRDAKQASLAAARAALAILREHLPAERGLRARVLGCLSNAELESPTLGLQGALQSLEQERDHCRSRGDLPGQSLAVTSAAALNFEFGLHQDALASAEEARALFKAAGDRLGEASALHLSAEVEAKEGHHANTLQAAQKAQALLEAVGDEPEGQASLQLLIAHAQLCLLQNAHHDPRSSSFRQAAEQATQSATRAVMLARKGNETRLVGSALCVLSQAEQLLAREGISSDACYRAANSAAAIFHQLRDQHGEASALLLCANAHIASGKLIPAKQAASKALLLFRELGDSTGKAKVEAALDAIENPTSPLESARSLPGTLQPVTTRISRAPDPEVFRQKVRKVVAEIVGMDDLEDETPLMQAGLTSQSAVLLRNALGKALPGSSLPFTMMFDFPSIAALTDYFVERAAPEEEEVFMHPEAATVQKEQGPDPEVLKRKVQAVVAKIVGMDDLEDDAPLMNSGLTSQSAVLLRNALSKELPGSSLPFTMMFDFPSVAALTEYFVERAAPDVGPSATAASHAHAQPELRQVPAAQDSSGKDALRAEQVLTKVRKVVSDIVGLDELEDDSPLMNSGLTSQHAVLLRQALSKGFGGSRLPHTMMFDFPSISDLTDFLLEQNLQ